MISDDDLQKLRLKLSVLLPELNERQRRLLLAAEANSLGHGGLKWVAEIAGVSRNTILKGKDELAENIEPSGAVRASGGGRKKLVDKNPNIIGAIEQLVDSDCREDPESTLKWTCKSVRNIEKYLESLGMTVSYRTIASILHGLGYSLKGNKKVKEGESHPDRDKQFRFISRITNKFMRDGNPVISVDTK